MDYDATIDWLAVYKYYTRYVTRVSQLKLIDFKNDDIFNTGVKNINSAYFTEHGLWVSYEDEYGNGDIIFISHDGIIKKYNVSITTVERDIIAVDDNYIITQDSEWITVSKIRDNELIKVYSSNVAFNAFIYDGNVYMVYEDGKITDINDVITFDHLHTDPEMIVICNRTIYYTDMLYIAKFPSYEILNSLKDRHVCYYNDRFVLVEVGEYNIGNSMIDIKTRELLPANNKSDANLEIYDLETGQLYKEIILKNMLPINKVFMTYNGQIAFTKKYELDDDTFLFFVNDHESEYKYTIVNIGQEVYDINFSRYDFYFSIIKLINEGNDINMYYIDE